MVGVCSETPTIGSGGCALLGVMGVTCVIGVCMGDTWCYRPIYVVYTHGCTQRCT